MRKDTLILFIAIVAGIVSLILIFRFVNDNATSTLQIVSLARDLKADEPIVFEDLAFAKANAKMDLNDLFLNPKDVVGKVPVKDLVKGALIHRGDVTEASSLQSTTTATGSLVIPENMRTMTLPASSLGSFPTDLAQGNYVDIIGLASLYEGSTQKDLQTLFRGAHVISIEKQDLTIKSITVAITPEAALLVTKAMAEGKLSLVGRPDDALSGALQSKSVGYTEIIRGVNKEQKVSWEPEKEGMLSKFGKKDQ